MTMTVSYRIADEPEPGRLADFVVTPQLPMIATFLGGSWIGLPWFVFNAHAMGSVERKRETRLALLWPVVALALALIAETLVSALHLAAGTPADALASTLGLPDRAFAYAAVVIVAVKLTFAYSIQRTQEKSFSIYEYRGGKTRNAVGIVIAAYILRPMLLAWAFKTSVWLGWVML